MTAYLLLFSFPAWFAISDSARKLSFTKRSKLNWCLYALILALAIGLRHEVGGDWFIYEENRAYFASLDLLSALSELGTSDPAFAFLCWLSPAFGGDYFVNLICGFLFTLGLFSFCYRQPNPWLALTVAIPYLVTVVAMGYTRQGVAIGLSMLALAALNSGGLLRFLLWIGVAASFHKSAVILIPLAIFSGSRSKFSSILGIAVIGPIVFILFLQESVDRLIAGYVSDGMESSGAFIRVMMNALPGSVFLLCRHRFALSDETRGFWTWMSVGALLFLPALAVSPSSTAVDRVALYWIPIQIFVWSRLPQAMSSGPRSELFIRQSVVAYSLAVLLVWLLFGDHAFAWLPYKFYPWVLIKAALLL